MNAPGLRRLALALLLATGATAPGLAPAAGSAPLAAAPAAGMLAEAEARVDAGAYAEAWPLARAAFDAAGAARDPALLGRAAILLAEMSRLDGDLAAASAYLDQADRAGQADPAAAAPWSAPLALARGHLRVAQDRPDEARTAYRRAAELGEQAGDEALVRRARVGELALSDPGRDRRGHAARRTALLDTIDRLPGERQRDRLVVELAVAIGADPAARPAAADPTLAAWLDERLAEVANATHAAAAPLADPLAGDRRRSLAHGLLARRHEAGGRPDLALTHARQAAFLAQDHPDLQYHWLQQSGRLLEAGGDADGAISAYRLAADALAALAGRELDPRLRRDAATVNGALSNLLLRKAATLPPGPQAGALLRDARRSIESLKAAELRDYFQDDCVTELRARITPVDDAPAGTAVIYPILLDDRLELLVSLPGDIRQVTVDVDRARLVQTIRDLRVRLEKRTTREYLPLARQAYRWLVEPLEAMLAAERIDTLVFVPDSALRLIPMGALHDGERFLIERFAVATTPGLTLTDARPLPAGRPDALLAGISKPVHGFAPLARVPAELSSIRAAIGGLLMEDERFALRDFAQALTRRPFTVVHIASHAEFDPDPARSFVAAFDERIGLERLGELVGVSQFRKQPIELLVLSACQTATGDERAALGLAGIAVRSGARSAVAGLWAVDDAATAALMADFYVALGHGPVSRARALQQAQLRMLADRRYTHPGFWAPFLLIGNWL